ncbi:hypothetical protein T11_5671 [Trichinella zimbabwensis]|uniref:Uncharacterized protein n=1 Tax=Trichinella zimbabwensis TaxID=268475 RepID=A0A0V1HPE2_9BILA|nr:hypothetical protein T11_5671 [Trichinella zimbabwensis]
MASVDSQVKSLIASSDRGCLVRYIASLRTRQYELRVRCFQQWTL